MPTRSIDTKISISGEKQYKQALSEINSGLNVLNSEMKKTTAQYQDNAKSVEALTAKGDVLQRTLLSQKEKVEELKKALEYAKNEYGESDKRTMQWEASLNKAETAVYNTEAAIRENNEALSQANENTEKGVSSVLDLADKLGIQLPQGARVGLEAMEGFGSKTALSIGVAVAAIKAAQEAVEKLADIAKEAARDVDDLVTESTKSGIDTYTLQVLTYMEDLADVDVSTVEQSIAKLTKSMSDARDGTEAATAAFAQLGVEFQNSDGTLKDADELLWEIVDSLGAMKEGSERDALAMELFGKKAQELNTLIAVGSKGFREFADEAENVGYILEEEELAALNAYNDALDRANKSNEALQKQLALEIAPALTELTEAWQKLKYEGLQLVIDSGIIDFLSDLVKVTGYAVDGIRVMIDVFNALMHPVKTVMELLGLNNEKVEENAKLTANANAETTALTGSVTEYTARLEKSDRAQTQMTSSLNTTIQTAAQATSTMSALSSAMERYVVAAGGTVGGQYGEYFFDSLGRKYSHDQFGSAYLGGFTDETFEQMIASTGIDPKSSWYYKYYEGSKYNAAGDQNFKGGLTWVGESGPELVALPQGSRIYSNQDSMSMGGDTFNITIDAKSVKEFEDIIRVAKNARMMSRKEG